MDHVRHDATAIKEPRVATTKERTIKKRGKEETKVVVRPPGFEPGPSRSAAGRTIQAVPRPHEVQNVNFPPED